MTDATDRIEAPPAHAPSSDALLQFITGTTSLCPGKVGGLAQLAAAMVGARSARIHIADYAFSWLTELRDDAKPVERRPVEGTLPGRAMILGEPVESDTGERRVWVPLNEGSERIGVLELVEPSWSQPPEHFDEHLRALVLVLISKRRYTDAVLRARRTEELSIAAEIQWDLLPPLTCTTERASVSGILEPAYSIGGDSFDYAFNTDALDFSIIDAVGSGMPAVMMAVTALNSLRNARREGRGLETAYLQTGDVIDEQYGDSAYVTGQFGELDLTTGRLRWVNAGHPPPLLVRDGSYVNELSCRPSLPMGLGGEVVAVVEEQLQRGDRLLFFTDGVTETRAPDGTTFGVDRLADYTVRVTLAGSEPAEAVRRLRTLIMDFNGTGLSDDATLLLIDYHGQPETT